MMSAVFGHPGFDPARTPLPELQAAIWAELSHACVNPHHPWRLPCLATMGDGTPCQRTVVLRRVEHAGCQLMAHTDARTAKIEQLRKLPPSSWLFYDPERRIQLIMAGNVQLHFSNAIADQEWAQLEVTGQIPYLAPHAPGEPSTSPSVNLAAETRTGTVTSQELEAGRENFAVMAARIHEIDLSFLRSTGHLRAKFHLESTGWHRTWVQP